LGGPVVLEPELDPMKAGRNDPCPCGSGKKYKKCCLARDQEEEAKRLGAAGQASAPPGAPETRARPMPVTPPPVIEAPEPPEEPDPIREKVDELWEKFQAGSTEERVAIFLENLADVEVMTADFAFEMLTLLHSGAKDREERARSTECINVLRERRPDAYDADAHYYLSWLLEDALADERLDDAAALARELAPRAGRDPDTFSRVREALAYYGQLAILREAMTIAWPGVKSDDGILGWAIAEFANTAADYEIFDYLEHTASPDPADPALLDRLRFFVEEPRADYLREFIEDLTAKQPRTWKMDDFDLKPPPTPQRDKWEDEEDEDEYEEQEPPRPGVRNLGRLISEFVGYQHREEGVPFPRADMVRDELLSYFVDRYDGDLNPRLGLMESMRHPKRKAPKPPRPAHPLCPERVTLEVQLTRMVGMLSGRTYSAAALFQAMPAWLRFLESRRLIDGATHQKVLKELRPLHDEMLKLWEKYTVNDPHFLHDEQQAWAASPAT
jgi:hypothetical protein